MNKEEDTYNKDTSNTLKVTQIENNTEENIVEINAHKKDKKDSREDKEVNVVENKKILIKENSDIEGVRELLEKNVDGVEEINDKCSDKQLDPVIPNVNKVLYNMNNSIIPDNINSYVVNEENEIELLPDCDGSGTDTVVKKKVLNEKFVNVKGVSEIVLNDEVTDVEEKYVKEKDEVSLEKVGNHELRINNTDNTYDINEQIMDTDKNMLNYQMKNQTFHIVTFMITKIQPHYLPL